MAVMAPWTSTPAAGPSTTCSISASMKAAPAPSSSTARPRPSKSCDLTAGDAETGTLEVATGAFAYAVALIVAAGSTSGSDDLPSTVKVDGDGSPRWPSIPTARSIAPFPPPTTTTELSRMVVAASGPIPISAPARPSLPMAATSPSAHHHTGRKPHHRHPALVVNSGGGIEVGGTTGLLADTLNIDYTGSSSATARSRSATSPAASSRMAPCSTMATIQRHPCLEGDLTGGGTVQIDETAHLRAERHRRRHRHGRLQWFSRNHSSAGRCNPVSASIVNFQEGDTIGLAGITGIAAPGPSRSLTPMAN